MPEDFDHVVILLDFSWEHCIVFVTVAHIALTKTTVFQRRFVLPLLLPWKGLSPGPAPTAASSRRSRPALRCRRQVHARYNRTNTTTPFP